MNLRASIAAAGLLLVAACGQPAASGPDGAAPVRPDAASLDATTHPVDAAATGMDASGPTDAAERGDAAWDRPDSSANDDAAADPPDSASEGPDAGASPADASDPGPDASLQAADAAPPAGPDASCSLCSSYSGASVEGLVPTVLEELSGLAMSEAHPGVLFAHNDSGDSAHFFALDFDGNLLGEFVLTGATAVDWEDIAIGPCPAGRCVYLGDIGDNNQVRTDYAVYRVPVPDVDVGDRLGTVAVSWERLPFQYPSGAKWNAETLLVHPQSGDVYVVNKLSAGKASTVFKFPQPLTPGVQVTLTLVAKLPVPGLLDTQLTGGDIHPLRQRAAPAHLQPALRVPPARGRHGVRRPLHEPELWDRPGRDRAAGRSGGVPARWAGLCHRERVGQRHPGAPQRPLLPLTAAATSSGRGSR
ncbi:MAG: hypothetical protein QM765_53095 [Myxococcales bacterium]